MSLFVYSLNTDAIKCSVTCRGELQATRREEETTGRRRKERKQDGNREEQMHSRTFKYALDTQTYIELVLSTSAPFNGQSKRETRNFFFCCSGKPDETHIWIFDSGWSSAIYLVIFLFAISLTVDDSEHNSVGLTRQQLYPVVFHKRVSRSFALFIACCISSSTRVSQSAARADT